MSKKPIRKNNSKSAKKFAEDLRKTTRKGNLKPQASAGGITGSYGGGSGIFTNFESARFSNKREWLNTPYPTDWKTTMSVFDRQEMVRKMRYLSVNSGLARQMITDNDYYSVGDGLKPQPASGDPEWNRLAYRWFMDLANSPIETSGRYNFWDIQHLSSRKIDIDGELFVLKTFDNVGQKRVPMMQLIESHRVGSTNESTNNTDNLWDGVLFSKTGKVLAYNCIQADGSGRLVPANSIMHVHHPEQISGARAYSPMQHAVNGIIDAMEIISLEKLAVKSNSDVVRTLTKETGEFTDGVGSYESFGQKPQDYPVGVYNNPTETGSFIGGKIVSLYPGEKLESFESQRPNATFVGMLEHIDRDSTQGVLPYEFVVSPDKAGAAMRLIVAKADRMFVARQNVLISRLCNPFYRYAIAMAIANGDLPAPKTDDWHRVEWITPRRVTVDAGRDAAANQRDLEQGVKTYSDDFAERGLNFEDEMDRRGADARIMLDKAAKYNVPVSMINKPANTPIPDIDSSVNGGVGANPDVGFVPLSKPGNP